VTVFQVGAPDWGEDSQMDAIAFSGALGASPWSQSFDVARWSYDLITFSHGIGAGAIRSLTAQWADLNTGQIFSQAVTLASLAATGSTVTFVVKHFGSQVTYGCTYVAPTPTLTVVHSKRTLERVTPYLPNYAGRVLLSQSVALGASGTQTYPMRGTGAVSATFAGNIYVGPAILSVYGGAGAEVGAYITDGVDGFSTGLSSQAAAVGSINSTAQIVQCPANDYTVSINNGATAQTCYVQLVAC
jgi:hypothetical protein